MFGLQCNKFAQVQIMVYNCCQCNRVQALVMQKYIVFQHMNTPRETPPEHKQLACNEDSRGFRDILYPLGVQQTPEKMVGVGLGVLITF